jgi:hypothetical protein
MKTEMIKTAILWGLVPFIMVMFLSKSFREGFYDE